jgi:hypothetical protein
MVYSGVCGKRIESSKASLGATYKDPVSKKKKSILGIGYQLILKGFVLCFQGNHCPNMKINLLLRIGLLKSFHP